MNSSRSSLCSLGELNELSFKPSLTCRLCSVSATNMARIYNILHRDRTCRFPSYVWPVTCELSPEFVLDSFFLFSLLRDHAEKQTVLHLRNDGDQSERLDEALRARNAAMVGPGQEHWNHGCDLCYHYREVDGRIGTYLS